MRQVGDVPRRTGQLQDMQAGVGAIDNVDVAPVVHFHVVRLDRRLAAFLAIVEFDAALVGFARDLGNIVGHFLGAVGVSNIDGTYSSVEVREKHQSLVIDRRHVLVGGMRTEPATAAAEIARGLGYAPSRHRRRMALDRDVDEPYELARLQALIQDLLVDHDDKVAHFAHLVLGKFRNRHTKDGKGGVRTDQWRHVEASDFGVAQVLLGWLLGSLQQLVAIHDLQHSSLVGAVAEIDAICRGSERDHAVQHGRYGSTGARLLTSQAEIADLVGVGRIGQIVDLGHARYAPARAS